MKLSWREGAYPCSNCGREFPRGQLDRRLWCPDCRRVVIRRATRLARIAALGTALVLGYWIFAMVGSSPRFLMAYLVMIVAAYFFIFKLAQRVAFEIIRERGVPPPPPETEDE